MKNIIKKLLMVLTALILTKTGLTQTTHELDLNKSIDLATEQSYQMKVLKEQVAMSEFNLKAATNRFKTKIDLNMTMPQYSESVVPWIDTSGTSFYSIKQLKYETNLEIRQPLPTDGYISLQSGFFNLDDYNEDQKAFQLQSQLYFRQPIDALYGYNNIRSNFIIAKKQYEKASLMLKREELDLIYEVSYSFYHLLSTSELRRIAAEALNRQTEIYEIAKQKYDAGLISEVEILQTEVDLGEEQNNYDIACVAYIESANNLKHILAIPLKDSVIVNTTLDYKYIQADPTEAVEIGLKNRMELRENEIDIELAKLELKRVKAQRLPEADIWGYFDLTGTDESPLTTDFTTAFNNASNSMLNRPGNKGIGLTVRVPIIDWGVNKNLANAQKARLRIEEYTLENLNIEIEKEIRNTVYQLENDYKRLLLLEKNVKLAEQSFEISRYRFENGDITSEELSLDRQRLNKTLVSYLSAYISYQLTLLDLKRKTFYDFELGESLIGE